MLTLFSIKFSPRKWPVSEAVKDCERLIEKVRQRFNHKGVNPTIHIINSQGQEVTYCVEGSLEVRVDDTNWSMEDTLKVSFFAQGFMASASLWER